MSRTPKVNFTVLGQDGVSAEVMRDELEKLSVKLNLRAINPTPEEGVVMDMNGQSHDVALLYGITDKKTYEKVFGAKLRWETKKVQCGRGPTSTVGSWVERKKAEVSLHLKGKIRCIELTPKRRLIG